MLHSAHSLTPPVVAAVAQRHTVANVLVLLLREWHSSAPRACREEGIGAHSLYQLIKAISSFVVVCSWEDTTHILDPADGVAVHVDAHSRVAFLCR
jgi:hypothetical protein